MDSVLTAFVITVAIALLVISAINAKASAAILIAAMTLPELQFAGIAAPQQIRFGAVPFGALLLMHAARAQRLGPATLKWLRVAMSTFLVCAGASLVWSEAVQDTILAVFAWGFLTVTLFAFPTALGARTSLGIVAVAAFVVVVTSVLAAAAGAPSAFVAGRLVGVVQNANGLGVMCLLSGLSVLRLQRWKLLWIIPFATCLATGSRAATGALLLGTVLMLWRQAGFGVRLVLMTGVASGFWLLTQAAGQAVISTGGETSVFRQVASRDDVWSAAWAAFASNPLGGIGFGAYPRESGSTPLKLLAEVGVVGALSATFVLATIGVLGRRDPFALSLLIAVIADCIFEGWLFTGGSTYAYLFYVLAASSLAGINGADCATKRRGASKIFESVPHEAGKVACLQS